MSQIIINRMNDALLNEELASGSNLDEPSLPIIFVTGMPRSGTTLLAQLLIYRFRLGYVTNLISRFWNAPSYGIALARSLCADPGAASMSLESRFGFTAGCEGHHEFGWYWQRWFPFEESHYLDPAAQNKVDIVALRRELVGMEQTWERPLLFKNAAALPLQTAFLARILPTSVFFWIERDDMEVAASLLKGRRNYLGDIEKWFSIKPPEYNSLVSMPLHEQIAGQIHHTTRALKKQMAEVPPERVLRISYTNLCIKPNQVLEHIQTFLNALPCSVEVRPVTIDPLHHRKCKIDDPILTKHINETFRRLGT